MTLHFDVRDLFRCVRLGWSGKKIWVAFLGAVASWLGYSGMLLIAYLQAGTSGGYLWHRYGLFPGARMGAFNLFGTALHLLGMAWVLAVALVIMCMLCKITFQQLRGDDFYSSGDAWKFAKKHWVSVLFGPLGALALFVFFVVAGIVIGWVAGWVPVAGELVFALGFLPIFFSALLAVFMAVAFLVSLSLSPAIVGTVGEDALEVVIQSFSLLWSQPLRLVLYLAIVKFCTWVGFLILGAMSISALWLITWACGLFMDTKLANLFEVATRYLPLVPQQWDLVLANLPTPGDPAGGQLWAGRILGFMLISLFGIIISYGLAALASGWSLVYVVLRHRKDGENMLEWKMEDWGHVDTVGTTSTIQPVTEDVTESRSETTPEEEDDSTDSEKA
ncbi:MAG: hypothetical protein O3B73_11035 [bacterium]|nr:hypothetical protein [bacterium]